MKTNYTEFIVRVYHKRRESSKHLFLQWLRFCLKPYLALRKVTVKKHKKLSEKKLAKYIEENFNELFYDLMWFRGVLPSEGVIAKRLAKAIYKAQEGKK